MSLLNSDLETTFQIPTVGSEAEQVYVCWAGHLWNEAARAQFNLLADVFIWDLLECPVHMFPEYFADKFQDDIVKHGYWLMYDTKMGLPSMRKQFSFKSAQSPITFSQSRDADLQSFDIFWGPEHILNMTLPKTLWPDFKEYIFNSKIYVDPKETI